MAMLISYNKQTLQVYKNVLTYQLVYQHPPLFLYVASCLQGIYNNTYVVTDFLNVYFQAKTTIGLILILPKILDANKK